MTQVFVNGKRVVAILPQVLAKFAREHGINVQQVCAVWKEEGKLITSEKGRLTKKTAGLGPDRPRAYWVVFPANSEDAQSPGAPASHGKRRHTGDGETTTTTPADRCSSNDGTSGTNGTEEEERNMNHSNSSISPASAPVPPVVPASSSSGTWMPADDELAEAEFIAQFREGG